MAAATPLAAAEDFSLVLGGPLYQLLRRAHLTGDTLELLRRRIIFLTLVAWLPLLVLTLAEGNATGQRRCLEREDPHDARQSTTLGPLVAAATHLSS